ncbi:TonB-dependent receptor [Vibrio gazogenes]|uniref:Receptor protein mostly Fe transport n=1 Tax=Vibrio gazogenes TaxID=687 RepID=A0A1Z2SIC8_VIBGA|nr:TonB-dependent receptor [Vibrio gazogenes]ASA56933.1 receptor protein mostly Fe transport [Vibrio gazogenes]
MKPMDLNSGNGHVLRHQRSILSTVIGLLCLGVSAGANAEKPQQQNKVQNPETIVVLGEKLGGTLAENTSSVTVFTAEADNGEDQTYYDLLDRVPNVLNAPSGMPHIRGVDGRGGAGDGFLSYMTGATPRVNTTVDGVSESWTGEAFGKAGLWDTEQVEVYKGPQSTNQGRNSIGGAVVIKTKDPTFHTESKVRAGYENEDDKYHLAGVVSAPIVADKLAFRLAAEGTRGHTPIEYSFSDNDKYHYPWDPSEIKSHNIRGKLLFKPWGTDKLTAKLTIASRNEEGQYTNLVTKEGSFENIDTRGSGTRRQTTKSWNVNLDVAYLINEELKADVLLARRDYSTKFVAYPDTNWWGDIDEKNYTVEAKLSYNSLDEKYSAIVGFSSYFKDQDTQTDSLTRFDKTQTHSIYFDSKIKLTQKWGLLLGARYERDELDRDFDHEKFRIDFKADDDNNIFLPKIGVTYDVSGNSTLGLTARKGYNAGGIGYNEYKKELFVFDQEEVWTYELSSRSTFLDKKLGVTANLFYNDYDNYHTVVYGDSGSRLDNYVANIPKGKTYGTEVETTYWFDSGLDVFASVGLLKTEVTQGPSGTTENLNGKEFSYAPDLSASLGFTQHLESGIFFGARANYVSEYYTDLANTKSTSAGDYTVVNLNAGYAADNFTIRAYVKNVTDENYVLRHKNDLFEIGAPRTFGIIADYQF